MTWHQRYLVRSYVTNSLWILPVLGLVAAMGTARLIELMEHGKQAETILSPESVRSVLSTLASSMFTCLIFAFSALLLAVQLASAQLTPRIIALVFRDPITKLSLTAFVFVFTLSLAVLIRIGDFVPMLAARLAAYSCIASLVLFLLMIDHVGKSLRPSGVLRTVASQGHRVIAHKYPQRITESLRTSPEGVALLDQRPARTVTTRTSGVILAVDIQGLLSLAERFDCLIIMLHQVGDFVAAGEPLFRVSKLAVGSGLLAVNTELPTANCLLPTLSDKALRHTIAVGQERTFQQDPALAFRIIVDIATKALSPAINDPTTAVLAIDQIHHLLRDVGLRHLDAGRVRDAAGRLRLAYRTPDWEDFVRLALTEIRQFGAASIQVSRRLRAMLENLIQTLPERRAALLRHELKLLHCTVQHSFAEPEDQVLAEVSDLQGVGGKAQDDLTRPACPAPSAKVDER